MTGKLGPQRWGRGQDRAPMVADPAFRKHVFFGGEMGADRGDDFRRYPNGDVE